MNNEIKTSKQGTNDNKKITFIKATIIGMFVGIAFVLAAKLVNYAMI